MTRDLTGPSFPGGSRYLYEWFLSINCSRSSNGFGPVALAATEIAAWCELSGHRLTPWEFDTIRKLDLGWRSIYAELHKPDQKPTSEASGGR